MATKLLLERNIFTQIFDLSYELEGANISICDESFLHSIENGEEVRTESDSETDEMCSNNLSAE